MGKLLLFKRCSQKHNNQGLGIKIESIGIINTQFNVYEEKNEIIQFLTAMLKIPYPVVTVEIW